MQTDSYLLIYERVWENTKIETDMNVKPNGTAVFSACSHTQLHLRFCANVCIYIYIKK